jgi:hypothetical protein
MHGLIGLDLVGSGQPVEALAPQHVDLGSRPATGW